MQHGRQYVDVTRCREGKIIFRIKLKQDRYLSVIRDAVTYNLTGMDYKIKMFTHLKLCLATANHNFKRAKINHKRTI